MRRGAVEMGWVNGVPLRLSLACRMGRLAGKGSWPCKGLGSRLAGRQRAGGCWRVLGNLAPRGEHAQTGSRLAIAPPRPPARRPA